MKAHLDPTANWLRWVILSVVAFAVTFGTSVCHLHASNFTLKTSDILVANNGADSVMKIDAVTGEVQSLGSFSGPTDIALSADGRLYVSEFEGSIFELNLNTGTRRLIKGPTSPDPQSMPDAIWALLIAPDGGLLVTRGYDDSIVWINPATAEERIISETNQLWGIAGMDMLDDLHVVVCSTFNNQLVSVDLSDGTQSPITTIGPGVDRPRGIVVFGTNIFTTTVDSREIRRLPASGGVVETFYTAESTVFGMAVHTNGSLVAGMDQSPFNVLQLAESGTLERTFADPRLSAITGVEISRINVTATGLPNTPPWLDVIPDRIVTEGDPLSLMAHAADNDWPPQRLTFSLGAEAPPGAVISSHGVFSWTPDETQGPGIYPVQVVVTDDDSPPLSTSCTFVVTVTESNSSPSLSLTNATVFEGDLLAFQATAADNDMPQQSFSFTLLPGAPEGATISTAGLFNWTPTDAQGPQTVAFDIKVTDNGVPPLSTTARIYVTINELYVQCSDAASGPYSDAPNAIYDRAAGSIRINRTAPACFYRLKSNLPSRIQNLELTETESILNYQIE